MSDSRKRGSRNQEEEFDELDEEDDHVLKRAPAQKPASRAALNRRNVPHADDDDDDDVDDEHAEHDDLDFDDDDDALKKRSKGSFVAGYLEEAKLILTQPRAFFKTMPVRGGFLQPLLFLLSSAAVFSLLQAIAKLNFFVLFTAMFSSFASAFVAAAVIAFACSKMGGRGSFESTFRVVAYSKVTLLFAWLALGPIPVGGVASLIYSVYLNIVGLEKTQKMPRKNVATLVIIVALIGFILKFRFGI